MSILVIFFGGYHATQANMDVWLASARTQRSDVRFEAFPYPEHAIADDGDKNDARHRFNQYDAVIQLIQDSGADQIFIVGHSSGCAIANELNSRIGGDHKNITLIDLDGFEARHKERKGSTVQVWSAEGPDGGQSLHWDSHHKMYHSAQATKDYSLHFSLVNTAATDDIKRKNYKDTGYAGCIANLVWLPPKQP